MKNKETIKCSWCNKEMDIDKGIRMKKALMAIALMAWVAIAFIAAAVFVPAFFFALEKM